MNESRERIASSAKLICCLLVCWVLLAGLLSNWASHEPGVIAFYLFLTSPETQWLVALALFVGISMLFFLMGKRPKAWLLFFGLVAVLYVSNYHDAVRSTNAVTLMAGLTLSCVVFWVVNNSSSSILRLVLTALIPILIGACIFVPSNSSSESLVYRSTERWDGIWGNPNVFGLLMAIGAAVLIGLWNPVQQLISSKRWKIVLSLCVFLLGCLLLYGLARSLSRGAWISMLVGISYVGWSLVRPDLAVSRNGVQAFVVSTLLVLSLLVTTMWLSRVAESGPFRRVGSALNKYDFSVQNRLLAYKQALRVIAKDPILGTGWNQSLRRFDMFTNPQVQVGLSISTNSYLKLTMSIGLLGLFLLLFIVFEALRCQDGEEDAGIKLACRAGVLTALVGFWFNGGLLTSATWPIFWMLVGLSQSKVIECVVSSYRPAHMRDSHLLA